MASNSFIDITGQTFNELTAIEYLGDRMWKFRCSCGDICIARKNDVTSGRKKSCGHLSNRGKAQINIGDTFNEWTVIEDVGDRKFRCRCSCGKEGIVHSYDLRKGNSKSCGHATKGIGINGRKDMTGQRIGEWSIGEYLGNGEYLCTCSCGVQRILKGTYLRTGQSKSCGHSTNAFHDLSGEVYGDWTVLKYLGDYMWECQCSCGNIKAVSRYDLISGKSTNCGCQRLKNDLKGQRFGKLVAEEYIGNSTWRCRCDCGGIAYAGTYSLISGARKSCGCSSSDKKAAMLLNIQSSIARHMANTNTLPFPEEIADDLNITPTTVNKYKKLYNLDDYFNKHFGSKAEKEIYMLIADKIGKNKVISREKKALGNGQELDIYIPSKNLAIEYNGDYWHSVDRVGENYHQLKTLKAIKQNIRLIQIFSHEWKDLRKQTIIIRQILNLIDDTIENTECTDLWEIDSAEAKTFLYQNSLNLIDSDKYLGLYNNTELIGVCQFNIRDKNIEIVNKVIKLNISVPTAIKDILERLEIVYKPNLIKAKIDISKSNGEEYIEEGFKIMDIESPNITFIDIATENIIESKDFNGELKAVYDCGNLILEREKNNDKFL